MSIFRETFSTAIKESLGARQKAMTDRTPDTIQYLNSRNSWIRMVSSVDVGGNNNSAKLNVLQGGTLNPTTTGYSLKSGVGDSTNAYSNNTSLGKKYKLGSRPMPGITSIDVKSKSAYGSLREVVVHFQCWDIRQLEELEQLYMRPGYTVLVEWGWTPYLDNKGKIVTTPPTHYDIINKGATELSVIAKALYDQSLLSGGNYDASFGYIKNYQWSARPDGGYDCQTTVISTGEIIESLKVNYVRPDLLDYKIYDVNSKGDGYLNPEFDPQGTYPSIYFSPSYEKNTLAGVWTELYYKIIDEDTTFKAGGIFKTIAADRGVNHNDLWMIVSDLKFSNTDANNTIGIGRAAGNKQIYVTLDVALEFINKYVTAKSSGGEPLVKFSLTTSDITNKKSEELLCLAHPLQVSVDPSVCLIQSPLWYDSTTSIVNQTSTQGSINQIPADAQFIYDKLKAASGRYMGGTNIDDFRDAVLLIDSEITYDVLVGKIAAAPITTKSDLASLITMQVEWDQLSYAQEMENHLNSVVGLKAIAHTTSRGGSGNAPGTNYTMIVFDADNFNPGGGFEITKVNAAGTTSTSTTTAAQLVTSLPNALGTIDKLKTIPLNYFYGEANGDDELGIIRNIYVNLDFLYRTAIDSGIESQDHKEKNEISLYKYVKNVMVAINTSLGSMNNFEVHVDPIDNNVARVIDINYTADTALSNLFELQVQNLNSVVRNYSLQSQIFPEQSAMIAIGSQVKGGQLGIQNNTMISFNKNIKDRIIPEKNFPEKNDWNSSNKNNIGASLANIIILLGSFNPSGSAPTSSNDTSALSQAKNSLRDIIVYFQSLLKSSSSSRSIIPVKLSFEIDGIGGLVIGHLFKVNKDILPDGYYKANLAQTITGISHTVGNGDWTTKIDALNIILEDRSKKFKFSKSVDMNAVIENAVNALTNIPSFNIISSAINYLIGGANNKLTQSAQKTALWGDSNFRTKLKLIAADFNIAEIDLLSVMYAECGLDPTGPKSSLYQDPADKTHFLNSPKDSTWKLFTAGLIQWTPVTVKAGGSPGTPWTLEIIKSTPAFSHADINKTKPSGTSNFSQYDQLDLAYHYFDYYRKSVQGKDLYHIYGLCFFPSAVPYLDKDDTYKIGGAVEAHSNDQIALAGGDPDQITIGGFKKYVDNNRLSESTGILQTGVNFLSTGLNIITKPFQGLFTPTPSPQGQGPIINTKPITFPGINSTGTFNNVLNSNLLPRPKVGDPNYGDLFLNPQKYRPF
jgi:hypothetical protein